MRSSSSFLPVSRKVPALRVGFRIPLNVDPEVLHGTQVGESDDDEHLHFDIEFNYKVTLIIVLILSHIIFTYLDIILNAFGVLNMS
jgi:hypothetical protein